VTSVTEFLTLLASELANRGATVTIIDADPNKPVSLWDRSASAN